MNTAEIIKKLSDGVCIGHIDETLGIVREYLNGKGEAVAMTGGSLAVKIKGSSDKKILLDAHIDEIGFTVTEVDERGFLKVAAAGGFDLRALPSHAVTVHGKRDIAAVFTSIPPHLSKEEAGFDDMSKLSVDSGLGEKAREVISVSDLVTFRTTAAELKCGRITGKSLDDRAGVAALLLVADKLSKSTPPCDVILLFSNQEELGCRGAKTAAFACSPDEAISIDVSFASFPGIEPHECGRLGKGPMIGFSPVLSREISDKLCSLADEAEIGYQREVMGGTTSTNADAIVLTKSGVPTGLVSIPERYMHSDCEVIDIADVEATAELLYKYVMSGGAANV